MRTTQRRIDPSVVTNSFAEPEKYAFFQLVHLYELYFRRQSTLDDKDPVNHQIKFKNSQRLGFAPSEVESIEKLSNGAQQNLHRFDAVAITPSFMGLLGIHGALPIHYTEQVVLHERKTRDTASRAFLDIFTDRAIGNFYKAWKKYRLPVLYEGNREQQFLPHILALCGLAGPSLKHRLCSEIGGVSDESLAYCAALLRQRPVSAESIKRILSSYFQVPIRIEQFVGQWCAIPEPERTTLGGVNAVLGENALAGTRVWQRNLRVRVWIGPLSHSRYMDFLPLGSLSAALCKLLQLVASGTYEFEIRPILEAKEVKPVVLSAYVGGRLGYDAFVISAPQLHHRADASYMAKVFQ